MRPVTTQQKPIYDRLNLLRRLLISHYIVIEAEYPLSVDPNFSKDDIYDNFTRVFSILKTVSRNLVLDFIPISGQICRRKSTRNVLGQGQ